MVRRLLRDYSRIDATYPKVEKYLSEGVDGRTGLGYNKGAGRNPQGVQMDIVAAKEAMRAALDVAVTTDPAMYDRLLDMVVLLGWAQDFGVEEEEEGA